MKRNDYHEKTNVKNLLMNLYKNHDISNIFYKTEIQNVIGFAIAFLTLQAQSTEEFDKLHKNKRQQIKNG